MKDVIRSGKMIDPTECCIVEQKALDEKRDFHGEPDSSVNNDNHK